MVNRIKLSFPIKGELGATSYSGKQGREVVVVAFESGRFRKATGSIC